MIEYAGRKLDLLRGMLLLLAVTGTAVALGQTASAGFEVSTVKANKSGEPGSSSDLRDGRFTATNVVLKNLMQYQAYGIPESRIVGGPKWLGSERFDIAAKLDGATADRLHTLSRAERRQELQKMFQQLLADRFQLVVHWETRELPIYALVAARNGPTLAASKAAEGDSHTSAHDNQLDAQGVTLTEVAATLTQELSQELGRVVVDRTGVTGRYDLSLHWTPAAAEGAAAADSGPSIFTAVQEQLGLKLESARGPVQVLVIDRAEMPSAN
jgi:uncharacterized protein (TIGR03435 family)